MSSRQHSQTRVTCGGSCPAAAASQIQPRASATLPATSSAVASASASAHDSASTAASAGASLPHLSSCPVRGSTTWWWPNLQPYALTLQPHAPTLQPYAPSLPARVRVVHAMSRRPHLRGAAPKSPDAARQRPPSSVTISDTTSVSTPPSPSAAEKRAKSSSRLGGRATPARHVPRRSGCWPRTLTSPPQSTSTSRKPALCSIAAISSTHLMHAEGRSLQHLRLQPDT